LHAASFAADIVTADGVASQAAGVAISKRFFAELKAGGMGKCDYLFHYSWYWAFFLLQAR
jgi:hypothetical protein